MTGMTLGEVVNACGALWQGPAALLDKAPENIVTDSRQAGPGSLFVAFRGERTDGHRYIPDVLAQGALAALCEEPGAAGTQPRIIVPEVMAAIRQAGAWNRARYAIPFIGVTGSVGKTTAKEMLSAVLDARFRTFRTPGSLNGQVGVPISLMAMEPRYDAAVIEMGISLPGEMERLTRVVRPDMAVFLNIGDAHLEALGDHRGILRAKSAMLEGMPTDAPIFCNGDDELLRNADFSGHPVTRFGLDAGCDVYAENMQSVDNGAAQRCDIVAGDRRIPVVIPAYGEYLVYAALAAAAVALRLGLTDGEIAAGVGAYETVGHRSRVLHTGRCTLVDDCYNANPTSNRAAIQSLLHLPGRKVCVLGDMREMGPRSGELHRALGRWAREQGVTAIYTQGDEAALIAAGAGDIARHFPDKAALLAALPSLIQKGDAVLVKASHGAHFEDVEAALEALE